MVPTLSVHQYAATLARWFGVDTAAVDRVAPGLASFTTRDLGFV